jgi:hypothetical protein
MTPKVSEAFRTSKLDRFFEIASSLEDALAALRWSVEIGCPIAGCEGTSLSHEQLTAKRETEVRCRSCSCRFRVAPFQLGPNGEARVQVSWFTIPTYEQEQIRAQLGTIVYLDLVGRLDLFVAEALVDACRSIPKSRRVMLDFRTATELSEPGLRLLKEHVRTDNSIDRFVALVDSDQFNRSRAILSNVQVTTTQEEAVAMLGGSPESDESLTLLLVSARVVDRTAEQSKSRDSDTPAG